MNVFLLIVDLCDGVEKEELKYLTFDDVSFLILFIEMIFCCIIIVFFVRLINKPVIDRLKACKQMNRTKRNGK